MDKAIIILSLIIGIGIGFILGLIIYYWIISQ